MKTRPIIVEQEMNASVSKVWEAITHRRQMKHWYFDIENFVPEFGAEFKFVAGPDGKEYTHLIKITSMVQEHKISYDWKYDGIEGDSHVIFELFAEGDHKTRVKLTHEGTDSFPAYDTNFSRESFEQGWTEIIKTSLKEFVEKK